MRYDDNHQERTRARLLAEAAAAIRSKGAERGGLAEVVAGADLTHGGFYAHFKSKDDLAQAITYMFDASCRHVGACPDLGTAARDRQRLTKDAARVVAVRPDWIPIAYLGGKVLNALLLDHVDYDVDRLRLMNAILDTTDNSSIVE